MDQLLSNFDMTLETEDIEDINEAIEEFKCMEKLDLVCTVQINEPPKPKRRKRQAEEVESKIGPGTPGGQGGPQPATIKLEICPKPEPPNNQQDGTKPVGSKLRIKRQAGPGGSGPGGSGPGGSVRPRPDEDFEKSAEFLKLYMSLDPETRYKIGHRIGSRESTLLQKNISSFIAGCTYKGQTCEGESFWYAFNTAEYGNCYSFNYNYNLKDTRRNRTATLTGTSYGLSVEIFLDQANYMLNKLSKQAGARIVIHDPTNPPLPDEYGMDLRPNTASSISVQMVGKLYSVIVKANNFDF